MLCTRDEIVANGSCSACVLSSHVNSPDEQIDGDTRISKLDQGKPEAKVNSGYCGLEQSWSEEHVQYH